MLTSFASRISTFGVLCLIGSFGFGCKERSIGAGSVAYAADNTDIKFASEGGWCKARARLTGDVEIEVSFQTEAFDFRTQVAKVMWITIPASDAIRFDSIVDVMYTTESLREKVELLYNHRNGQLTRSLVRKPIVVTSSGTSGPVYPEHKLTFEVKNLEGSFTPLSLSLGALMRDNHASCQ